MRSWIDGSRCKLAFNPAHLQMIPNFISPQESLQLTALMDAKLDRLCRSYQSSHFDSVIHGYREASISDWDITGNTLPSQILQRLVRKVNLEHEQWTTPHVLDLKDAQSGIKAHVDHTTASGSIIMGICLLSPAVMIFRHVKDPSSYFQVLLEPNCAYIQRYCLHDQLIVRDDVRYNYTHEIPSGDDHTFNGQLIPRQRRLALLLRNQYQPGMQKPSE